MPSTPNDDPNTERTVVKTYVPRYQKQLWLDEADRLDITQSEFLRTMVQAGRRNLLDDEESNSGENTVDETRSDGSNPGGDGLETRLLDALSSDEYRTWDELVDLVIDDFEEDLEDRLQSLTQAGTVEHSPRRGGYSLVEGSDG